MNYNRIMEDLIYRIVRMISIGLTRNQIADELDEFDTQENIFLAYHAAQILYDDWVKSHS